MPRAKKNTYSTNGVYVTPSDYSEGDSVTITYDGLLAQSGASEIYAHVGYGAKNWSNITDVKMSKTDSGFKAVLPVSSSSPLNIVFKDALNNWDNNAGSNYSFKVTSDSTSSKTTTKPSCKSTTKTSSTTTSKVASKTTAKPASKSTTKTTKIK